MIAEAEFRPAPWCRSPHAQTVVAGFLRWPPALDLTRETIELADGDFLDLSLTDAGLAPGAPATLILAGITGGPDSPYVRGLAHALGQRGIRCAVVHYRGLARPNRLRATYHSGRTNDIEAALDYLAHRFPKARQFAVGYSLGANMLLKYLGERGETSRIKAAVAVSVPFDLAQCAETINRGVRRSYQRHLLRDLKAMARAKQAAGSLPIAAPDWSQLTTFAAFDDAVTAPVNGFRDAADYYARASCAPYLPAVRTPTLIVHARDDPFMTPSIIPPASVLSDTIRLELANHGGHVGFVGGGLRRRPRYWLEERIPRFVEGWAN